MRADLLRATRKNYGTPASAEPNDWKGGMWYSKLPAGSSFWISLSGERSSPEGAVRTRVIGTRLPW